jgi:hypothetical protein
MTAGVPAGTLGRVELATIAIALCATAIAAAPASADSIVYAKQGNLHLSSADGSKGYQLTFDGATHPRRRPTTGRSAPCTTSSWFA